MNQQLFAVVFVVMVTLVSEPLSADPVMAANQPAAVKRQAAWVTWLCDVVYMPQRRTWLRQVAFQRGEGRRPAAVHIDGVPVYTFTVQDGVVRTALDNERIQIDLQAATWRSDFRGLASGAGRCDPGAGTPPSN